MPLDTALDDDDYVISILKKDANANRNRFLQSGLGSLLSKRPRGNAPKPNTRFLRNIIRDTDNHNAALKIREEEESKARLRDLQKTQSRAKRRRDEDDGDVSSKRRKADEKPGRWAGVLGSLGQKPEKRRERHRDDNGEVDAKPKHHESSRSQRSKDKSRRHRDSEKDKAKRRHSESRSRSPQRRRRRCSRSRSPATPSNRKRKQDMEGEDIDLDSDSQDDSFGPKPLPKHLPRGRGALKPSEMDSRFDPNYDPKTDVSLDLDDTGDGDDWDMALEAVRDRAKWRANGADRLRAAGFTEDEVQKWEKGESGSGEKDVADVRWRKKGESREWDRGKVVDEDGRVDVKPEWGRLKGT